jgi:hypothetical protein
MKLMINVIREIGKDMATTGQNVTDVLLRHLLGGNVENHRNDSHDTL